MWAAMLDVTSEPVRDREDVVLESFYGFRKVACTTACGAHFRNIIKFVNPVPDLTSGCVNREMMKLRPQRMRFVHFLASNVLSMGPLSTTIRTLHKQAPGRMTSMQDYALIITSNFVPICRATTSQRTFRYKSQEEGGKNSEA